MKFPPFLLCVIGLSAANAQQLAPAPAANSAPAQPAPAADQSAPPQKSSENSGFLGKDVPMFDPGSETITFDGKTWNVNNNRIFQARFEKYLNAPEQDSIADKEYNDILQQILNKLNPTQIKASSLDAAFKLLAKASAFEMDAQLCDALANQVHSSWLALRARERLVSANRSLEEEQKQLQWNARMEAVDSKLDGAPGGDKDGAAVKEWRKQQQLQREVRMQPLTTRLAEVMALQKANQLKQEVSELQARIQFQALIWQLFVQRRFQHVLIGTRFYRSIFNDGDGQLKIGEEASNFFAKTSGLPPTIGTLDTVASEIIRDVREGVRAFTYLIEKAELESATKRLAENYIVGEYLPEIRTLPRDEKRKALAFAQKANQLISALEVKDYSLAEKIVDELSITAKDFDSSKPMAAVQTAKTVASMHLAKARNAAVSGDRTTLETELRSATEIWPRNPALAEVSGLIFSQADVQQRALIDFDQLVSQKNYRQIYDDRVRFIAATAMHPEKGKELQTVLENMAIVESALIRAQEIQKRGDSIGAWESAERAYTQFPDDNKLNQVRATLTTQAADFVRTLRTAEELEKKKQPGSSLAWYLKAQQQYPPSEFAREGVDRLIHELLPDAT